MSTRNSNWVPQGLGVADTPGASNIWLVVLLQIGQINFHSHSNHRLFFDIFLYHHALFLGISFSQQFQKKNKRIFGAMADVTHSGLKKCAFELMIRLMSNLNINWHFFLLKKCGGGVAARSRGLVPPSIFTAFHLEQNYFPAKRPEAPLTPAPPTPLSPLCFW